MNPYSFATSMLAILLCVQSVAIAQASYNYIPIQDDATKLTACRKQVTDRYKADSIATTGENKKYIVDLLRSRYRSIDALFKDKELVSNAEVDAYLTNITNEIIRNNPELKAISPQFYFSRAGWPNAYSTGEGTIVFNMDLFVKLKNESQVAFVLCHELAHLFLDHSKKRMDKYINTVYSKEFQEKLKEINKTTYDKNKELEKLEIGFAFNTFRHSRDTENEADAKGFAFMKNTKYDLREALTCLGLLDEIDDETIDVESILPKVFSFDAFPFKKRWIEKEEAFFGGVETKTNKPREDSLKTHPDCKVRIKTLEPMVAAINVPGAQSFLQPATDFNSLQSRFSFEIVQYYYERKQLSHCLFSSLKLFQQYPDNAYLVDKIGLCLVDMYQKQKEHELYTVAEMPSPYKDKKYNVLLEFINRLSLNDLNNLAYHFLQQHRNPLAGNPAYQQTLERSIKNFTSAAK